MRTSRATAKGWAKKVSCASFVLLACWRSERSETRRVQSLRAAFALRGLAVGSGGWRPWRGVPLPWFTSALCLSAQATPKGWARKEVGLACWRSARSETRAQSPRAAFTPPGALRGLAVKSGGRRPWRRLPQPWFASPLYLSFQVSAHFGPRCRSRICRRRRVSITRILPARRCFPKTETVINRIPGEQTLFQWTGPAWRTLVHQVALSCRGNEAIL